MFIRQPNGSPAPNTAQLQGFSNIYYNIPPSSTSQTQDLSFPRIIQESNWCRKCNTSNTPEWRRGPAGSGTLCNTCGQQYNKASKSHEDVSAYKDTYPNNPHRPYQEYVKRKPVRKRKLRRGDCKLCTVKESPEWREGPEGKNTLCNPCGIAYKNYLNENVTTWFRKLNQHRNLALPKSTICFQCYDHSAEKWLNGPSKELSKAPCNVCYSKEISQKTVTENREQREKVIVDLETIIQETSSSEEMDILIANLEPGVKPPPSAREEENTVGRGRKRKEMSQPLENTSAENRATHKNCVDEEMDLLITVIELGEPGEPGEPGVEFSIAQPPKKKPKQMELNFILDNSPSAEAPEEMIQQIVQPPKQMKLDFILDSSPSEGTPVDMTQQIAQPPKQMKLDFILNDSPTPLDFTSVLPTRRKENTAEINSWYQQIQSGQQSLTSTRI